jgi:hypothetical protein
MGKYKVQWYPMECGSQIINKINDLHLFASLSGYAHVNKSKVTL